MQEPVEFLEIKLEFRLTSVDGYSQMLHEHSNDLQSDTFNTLSTGRSIGGHNGTNYLISSDKLPAAFGEPKQHCQEVFSWWKECLMGDYNDNELQNATDKEKELLLSMRTKIEEQDPHSRGIDDAMLLRFLRARSLNVEKSTKLLVQHLKWRRSFVPLGYIPEEEIVDQFQKEMICLQGHDKQGRAIGVLLGSRHIDLSNGVEDLKRFIVYSFDKATASTRDREGKFLVIVDLAGLRYKNIDIRGLLACLNILQDHYPERLGKLFIVHVPYIFWGAWKIIYPFIDEVTRRKIIFVEDKNLQHTLLKEIAEDQLPDIFGGKLPLVPIHLSVVPNWPPRNPDV